MARRPTRSLVAWSLVGLIAGHQATYFLVYRDPNVIGNMLAATGHGWLWLAPLLLASAPLTALVLSLRESGLVRPFRSRLLLLALIQVTTFLALEVAERAVAGVDGWHLVHALFDGLGWQVLSVGVAVQIAVAALLALASQVVERVVRGLRAGSAHRSPRRARSLRRPVTLPRPHGIVLAHIGEPRAPPAQA